MTRIYQPAIRFLVEVKIPEKHKWKLTTPLHLTTLPAFTSTEMLLNQLRRILSSTNASKVFRSVNLQIKSIKNTSFLVR